MKKTLKGKVIAFSGTFGDRSRSQLTQALDDLGARASNKINTKTDLFIEGHRASGSKLEKARMSGVPIIDLDQLEQLFSGATLDEVLGAVEETTVATASLEDLLSEVRELLIREDRPSWEGLCALFDKTTEEDLDALLDYVVPHTSAWATEMRFGGWWRAGVGDVREAPQAWVEQMLTGRDSKKMQIIRVLNLQSKKLVGKVAAKLFEVSHLDNLLALDVGNNKLPVAFFKQLADSGMWSTLRFLSICRIPMRLSGWKALASASQLSSLTHLDISSTQLDDDGIDALLEADHLRQLTHLNLSRNRFTTEGLKKLLQSPMVSNLRFLYLDGNDGLSDDIGRYMAESEYLKHLEVLEAWGTGFGPASMAAMVTSDHFQQLRELNLSHSAIGDDGLKALAESPYMEGLRELNLNYCQIGDEGIAAFAESPVASRITKLDVHGNTFGVPGAEAIAQSTQLSQLKSFQCGNYDLPEAASIAIIKSKNLSGLEYLWLGNFKKGSDAAKAINNSRHWSKEISKMLKGCITE